MTRAQIEQDPIAYIQHLDATLAATSEQINTRLDHLDATVAHHGTILLGHTAKLTTLARVQAEQGEMLERHGEMLERHGEMLERFGGTLERQGGMLEEILRRLPAPEGDQH